MNAPRTRPNFIRLLPLCLLLLVLQAAGCKSNGQAPMDGGPAADGGMIEDGGAPASIYVEPAEARLSVGETARLSATAFNGDGGWQDITDLAVWTNTDNSVVQAEARAGRYRGLMPGNTSVRASWKGLTSSAALLRVYPREQYEGRGIWVTRWRYTSISDIRTIMEDIAKAGLNIVYWQVRGRGDAFYLSSLEPWAQELSGTLGRHPGWDPLATAVIEAHKRGLELHAWVNVFSAWSGSSAPPATNPRHIYNTHPEWILQDEAGNPMPLASGEYVWSSPGLPASRAHNLAVFREIVENYAVDGLHLDRIRYPGSNWGYEAYPLYEQAKTTEPELTFSEWRRRQVNAMVRETYEMLQQRAPGIPLSAAVGCKYKNDLNWSSVSISYSGSLQDSRAWMKQGIIDQLIPMCYWGIKQDYGARLDFAWLVDDTVDDASQAGYDRHIFIGASDDYDDFAEIAAQIEYTRAHGAQGIVLYAYKAMMDRGYVDDLASGPFAIPAVVPFEWWRY